MSLTTPVTTITSNIWRSVTHPHFTRARDVIGTGYLGKVEDELVHWWDYTWTPIRAHIASRRFIDQLGPNPTSEMMIALTHTFIDRGAQLFAQHSLSAVSTVVQGCGMNELTVIDEYLTAQPVEKALGDHNPFRQNTAAWWRWLRRYGQEAPTIDPYSVLRETTKHVTAAWIPDITTGQKRQVERMIKTGFTRKRPVEEIAGQISNVIGLNQRWAIAVDNLRTRMIASGYSPAIIAKRCKSYSDGLVHKRGVMVARTEIMLAVNAGEYSAWKIKRDNGELDDWVIEKWLQPMEDACPECWDAADPDATGEPKIYQGLDATFGDAELVYPPIHPHCRCRVEYRLVKKEDR